MKLNFIDTSADALLGNVLPLMPNLLVILCWQGLLLHWQVGIYSSTGWLGKQRLRLAERGRCRAHGDDLAGLRLQLDQITEFAVFLELRARLLNQEVQVGLKFQNFGSVV